MKQPAVYMLASQRNGTLYIGVTSDLIQRIWQHKEGLAEGFTKTYGVKMLVWYEQHETMESAIRKEKAMKKWLREWKLKTIEQTNPDWHDLWPEITGEKSQAVVSSSPVVPYHPREGGGNAGTQQKENAAPVIPCHPREGGGNAGIQQDKNAASVIPAQAGIQQDKNAFELNPLDSRIRGNDGVLKDAR